MQTIFSQLIGALSLFLFWIAYRTLEWAWFRPRRLDQALREQGLRGTAYRTIIGDMKEDSRLKKESCTKPMPPLSHDIAPRLQPLFHCTIQEHGKLSFTWFGPTPRVIVTDPELVREVLSNKFGNFVKAKFSGLSKMLVNGVAAYDGDKWAKHRRILNPAFHFEKLKCMLPAFSASSDELINKWENLAKSNGSFELDILHELHNLTGDVISRAAFGSSYEEGRRIFQILTEQQERLAKAVKFLHIPFHFYLPMENIKKMKANEREVITLVRGIIEKREKAIQEGEKTNNDLLDLLMESNMREMVQNGNSSSNLGISMEDMVQECKLFYFAGQETTAGLLTWTMILLSMHLEWQEKAREEVLKQFGKNKPDFDGLNHLKIVSMILYEVLRLYPPLVMMNRRTNKRMQLGNITCPSGILLVLPILMIHHDKQIWGPDASEFKPDRFAEGISKATKNGQVKLRIFVSGVSCFLLLKKRF